MKTRKYAAACLASMSLLLAACNNDHNDGDDDGDNTPVPTSVVSGIAAVGSPIIGGNVRASCVGGVTRDTTTNASGAWSTSVPTASLPCTLRVSGGTLSDGAANTQTLYSQTMGGRSTVHANITPMTDLALSRAVRSANGQSLTSWFDGGALQAEQVASAVGTAQQTLLTSLRDAGYTVPEGFEAFTQAFEAVTGNDYDDLLEAIGAAIEAGGQGYEAFRNSFTDNAIVPDTTDETPAEPEEPQEPEEPGEPEEPENPEPPVVTVGDGILGNALKQVFAGDYVLKCSASPGQAVQTFAFRINPDGSSVFNGAPLVDATHPGKIISEGDLASSITLSFTPSADDSAYVVLGFKEDGSFFPNSVRVPGEPYGQTLFCHYNSGNTAPSGTAQALTSIVAAVAALARTETVSCSQAGVQSFGINSDAAVQIGSEAYAASKLFKISDGILFDTNKIGKVIYSDIASGPFHMLAFAVDAAHRTTGVQYAVGLGPNDSNSCVPVAP